MKICTKCRIEKPLDQFSPKNGHGLSSHCKSCRAGISSEFRRRKKEGKVPERVLIIHAVQNGIETRPCSICRRYLALHNFGTHLKRKDKLNIYCKSCKNARGSQLYHERHKSRAQNQRLLKLYGISNKERGLLFQKQQGRCALCGRSEQEYGRTLHVDHIHGLFGPESIRGLLCDTCNGRFLPMVLKYPRLQNALVKEYLNRRPLLTEAA